MTRDDQSFPTNHISEPYGLIISEAQIFFLKILDLLTKAVMRLLQMCLPPG